METAWCQDVSGGVVLHLWIQPRARTEEVVGPQADGTLKIRLTAPPVDSAANIALLRFLAERLGVPRSRVTLTRGGASRRKSVQVGGVDADTARARLTPGAAPGSSGSGRGQGG